MIQLYEVIFPLDNGYYLNLITAAPNESTAILDTTKVLRSVGVVGYDPNEVTVKAVTMRTIPAPVEPFAGKIMPRPGELFSKVL